MAYTETLPSSFRMNTKETVDVVFSKILVANLFKDETFVPGVTFTDKYNERGGQIYARKLGKITATEKDATADGGLDLVHTQTKDSLILIQKKDYISISEKCYDTVDNLRASGKSVDKVAEVVASFKEACQKKYVSYLLADPAVEGAVGVGGATRSTHTAESANLETLVADILADREQIRVAGGMADTLIISPSAETLFLANAYTKGNAFIPETNEELIKNGKVGRLYGMNVYTSNLIGAGNTGVAQNTEYVVYDHDAFAIAADIEGLRLKDAEGFFGSYAQIAALVGGGITNKELAIAKVTA
jgi:hypothetical protein